MDTKAAWAREGLWLRNSLGAFGDAAVLFPLLWVLHASAGLSLITLCYSAGLTYVVTAWLFRLPVPVQPLKALAMAAVTSGATALEVRWAGAGLGLACLLLYATGLGRWLAQHTPRRYVHAVQLSLGLLLVLKGWAQLLSPATASAGSHGLSRAVIIIAGLALCVFLLRVQTFKRVPLLGLLALASFTVMVITAEPQDLRDWSLNPVAASAPPRWLLVASLLAPQLLLTTSNSVLGTADCAQHYFGAVRARRVTVERLLLSIACGNLIQALIGGLPFCHGAGGLTAHVRAGSNHWLSNLVMGSSLLALAAYLAWYPQSHLQAPPFMLAVLLICIGAYHVRLAAPTWRAQPFAKDGTEARRIATSSRFFLLVVAAASLYSQNILLALGAGLLADAGTRFLGIIVTAKAHKDGRRAVS